MRISFSIFFILVLAGCLLEASARCLCGATGSDYCSCNKHIVRPAPLAKIDSRPRKICKLIGGAQEYRPIGDTCSCGNHIVEPANPPRPCAQRAPNTNINSNNERTPCAESVRAPEGYQGVDVLSTTVYASDADRPSSRPSNLIPADAVSLSLAYRLGQMRTSVPEEGVQYGFRKKPLNGEQIEVIPDIPEEKLWSLDRAVIEFKHKAFNSKKPDSDEEEDDDENDDNYDGYSSDGPSYLSYSDIGFAPEKMVEPKFDIRRYAGIQEKPSERPSSIPLPYIGNCGYQPGRVVVSRDGEIERRELQNREEENGFYIRNVDQTDDSGFNNGYDRVYDNGYTKGYKCST